MRGEHKTAGGKLVAVDFEVRDGRLAGVVEVDLPRPRPAGSPEVARLVGLVTERLREEVSRHAGR